MKKSIIVAALVAAGSLVQSAQAESRGWVWSPLGVGIAAPAQLPLMSSSVYGIRFGGLYGRNVDVYGIDAGFLNIQENFAGIQAAAFSWTVEDAYGIQAAAASINSTFAGLQLAALNWNGADSYGVQLGIGNADQAQFTGIAIGGVNFSLGFEGFQLGVINLADDMTGFQLGLFNATQRLDGVQIGFLNLICESKFPVMIIANAAF